MDGLAHERNDGAGAVGVPVLPLGDVAPSPVAPPTLGAAGGAASARPLDVENRILRSEVGYWRAMHGKAVAREKALKEKIEQLEAKVRLRERQLFERRSERGSKGGGEASTTDTSASVPCINVNSPGGQYDNVRLELEGADMMPSTVIQMVQFAPDPLGSVNTTL